MGAHLRSPCSFDYNTCMAIRIKCIVVLALCAPLFFSCASTRSRIEHPQFSQWHYTFTVLFDPASPQDSPQLDLAMSLLQMHFPPQQAAFVSRLLYGEDDLDSYADRVLQTQRSNFRMALAAGSYDGEDYRLPDRHGGNWRYAERISVNSYEPTGVIIGRDIESYTGGAHGLRTSHYFLVDLDALRLVELDDLFQDFQGERMRDLVYEELRHYSGLEPFAPLSQGYFFSDEPELSQNFYVTQDGLGFIWDPYAIAPYSQGMIDLFIPWRRVRPLLLRSGMELLIKFGIDLLI